MQLKLRNIFIPTSLLFSIEDELLLGSLLLPIEIKEMKVN